MGFNNVESRAALKRHNNDANRAAEELLMLKAKTNQKNNNNNTIKEKYLLFQIQKHRIVILQKNLINNNK